MIELINNNIDLYKPEKIFWEKSLDFSKTLEKTNGKIVFHCFWRVPKEFGRKQLAVIKSIIVNHLEDLENLEINLWSNVDLSKNEYVFEVLPYIKLRKWDISQEIKNTTLDDCSFLNTESINDNLCYLEGDLFRLLVLHNYGGFYLDMDVLVLRNMSPLNNFEFLYQWGTSGFANSHPNITMNGAVMRLNKKSKLSEEFLILLKNTKPQKDSFVWGTNLYSKISQNNLLVLPCIWFNSEWGFEGAKLDPFNNIGDVDMYDGAFTWHWHNKWEDEIKIGSKFEILEKKHNEIFKEIK